MARAHIDMLGKYDVAADKLRNSVGILFQKAIA